VNADSLATWFLPAVQELMQRRRLLFDVMMDDQDYTHELMRSGHVAGCIGTRDTPIQGGECHFLGCMRYLCLATPDFAARYFADGFTHAALAQAPAIIFSGKDDLHSQFLRQVASYDGSTPHLTLPTPQGFVQATRLGLAYSLLPELMIDDDLQTGRLINLLPGQYVDLPLYWHHWRVESSLAADLSAALLSWAQVGIAPATARALTAVSRKSKITRPASGFRKHAAAHSHPGPVGRTGTSSPRRSHSGLCPVQPLCRWCRHSG
jgi:LysR family transcriptional regulator (chromosome initiation inhibitor)